MVQGERSSGIVRLHRGRVQAVAGEDLVKRVAAFAEGNRFEVHTQNAVAGIRGTNMLVACEKGATVVIFISGHGYLFNPVRPGVIVPITAGNMSIITSLISSPTQPTPATNALMNGLLQAVTPGQGSGAAPGGTGGGLLFLSTAGAGGGSGVSQFTNGIAFVSQQQQGLLLVQQLSQQSQQQLLSQVSQSASGPSSLPLVSSFASLASSLVYNGSSAGALAGTLLGVQSLWAATQSQAASLFAVGSYTAGSQASHVWGSTIQGSDGAVLRDRL